jgi:hypothetical protein
MVTPEAWRERQPKKNPRKPCCWVCGESTGAIFGFTNALRRAGYRLRSNEIGYAHTRCLVKANREHQQHKARSFNL